MDIVKLHYVSWMISDEYENSINTKFFISEDSATEALNSLDESGCTKDWGSVALVVKDGKVCLLGYTGDGKRVLEPLEE